MENKITKKNKKPIVNVIAFIERDDGKLLILSEESSGNVKWHLPGGTVQVEDTYSVACLQKIKLQLGLDFDNIENFGFDNSSFNAKGERCVSLYFKIKWPTNQDHNIKASQFDGFLWFDALYPPEPMNNENVKKMIIAYGEAQKSSNQKKTVKDVVSKAFFEKILEKERSRKLYIKSAQSDMDINAIKAFFRTTECKRIDYERAVYFPGEYPVDAEKIDMLVQSIMQHAKCDAVFREDDNAFPNEVREYKGLIFRLVTGQGTGMQIWDKEYYQEMDRDVEVLETK